MIVRPTSTYITNGKKDSRKSYKTPAYNMLISLRDKLTHLNGVITSEAVNKLEDDPGRIFKVAKIHHYKQDQKYGHLVSAIPELKYSLIIGNAAWVHSVPADPGAYSQAALVAGNVAAQQEQLVAEQKILKKSYNDYLGIEEVGKEQILNAVGNDALAPLKKTIHQLWRHDDAWNDRLPLPQNSNQDDDGSEAQVQVNGIQHLWTRTRPRNQGNKKPSVSTAKHNEFVCPCAASAFATVARPRRCVFISLLIVVGMCATSTASCMSSTTTGGSRFMFKILLGCT